MDMWRGHGGIPGSLQTRDAWYDGQVPCPMPATSQLSVAVGFEIPRSLIYHFVCESFGAFVVGYRPRGHEPGWMWM